MKNGDTHLNSGTFWTFIAVMVILFWGEPDLLDLIKNYLISATVVLEIRG
jgi:hypothetical protein